MRVIAFDIGVRTLSTAIVNLDKESGEFHIDNWKVTDVLEECGCEATNASRVTLEEAAPYFLQHMIRFCNDTFQNNGNISVDAIVIEDQPSMSYGNGKNFMGQTVKNKVYSYVIYSALKVYFDLKSQFDSNKTSKYPPIHFQSSKAKLKVQVICSPSSSIPYFGELTKKKTIKPTSDEEDEKKKGGYRENKKQAIEVCKNFLKEYKQDKKFIDFFNSTKKKDDPAEALLHALYYLVVGSHLIPKGMKEVRIGRKLSPPTEKGIYTILYPIVKTTSQKRKSTQTTQTKRKKSSPIIDDDVEDSNDQDDDDDLSLIE